MKIENKLLKKLPRHVLIGRDGKHSQPEQNTTSSVSSHQQSLYQLTNIHCLKSPISNASTHQHLLSQLTNIYCLNSPIFTVSKTNIHCISSPTSIVSTHQYQLSQLTSIHYRWEGWRFWLELISR